MGWGTRDTFCLVQLLEDPTSRCVGGLTISHKMLFLDKGWL